MKRFKNVLVLLLVAVLISTSLVACSSDTDEPNNAQPVDTNEPDDTEPVDTPPISDPVDVVLLTAGTSGAWYPIGTGMAEILSGLDNNLFVTAEVTNGGIENARVVGGDSSTLGFINNDGAYFALHGEDPFEQEYNLRSVAHLYPSTMQIVVMEDSGINSIEDLRGKKVVVGPPASSSAVMSWNVFAEYGIGENDIEGLTLSFAEGADAMKDGHADCLVVVSAHPNSAITELSFTNDVKLIPIEADMQAKIAEKFGYYGSFTIPSGTYAEIEGDIPTLSLGTMIIANADTTDDAVYEFVKGIYENLEELSGVHAMAKNIAIDHAALVPIPLHPGAERYYQEVGIID